MNQAFDEILKLCVKIRANEKNGIFSNEYMHSINPLPLRDAGHGLIFTNLNSKKYLVLHADNSISGSEYPVLIPVTVKDKKIIVESKL